MEKNRTPVQEPFTVGVHFYEVKIVGGEYKNREDRNAALDQVNSNTSQHILSARNIS